MRIWEKDQHTYITMDATDLSETPFSPTERTGDWTLEPQFDAFVYDYLQDKSYRVWVRVRTSEAVAAGFLVT